MFHSISRFIFPGLLSRVHATLQPALSVSPSVCNTLLFWRSRAVWGLLLLSNSLVGLFHHCSCPSARDLGSRVSGLVYEDEAKQRSYLLRLRSLVAYTQLYKRLCLSVHLSVRRSISPFVHWAVRDDRVERCENTHFSCCS